MSDRDRSEHHGIVVLGVVTFLLIFGLIGYFLGIDQNLEFKHEQHTKQEQAKAAEDIESDCLRAGVISQECTQEKIETYRAENDGSEDLSAQKQMAYWAKWLLLLTAVTTGISVLAVVYVARTLDLTKDTLIATQRMAEDTREFGRIETKAYVSIESAVYTTNLNGIFVEFQVRNIGKTPARLTKIKGRLRFHFLPRDEAKVLPPHFTFCVFEAFAGVVEPGKTTSAFDFIPHTEFKGDVFLQHVINNETGDIHCDLSWKDVFKKTNTERHILNKRRKEPFIGPSLDRVFTTVGLSTVYTGKARDQEESSSEQT